MKGEKEGQLTGNGGMIVECHRDNNQVVYDAMTSVDLGNDYEFDKRDFTHKKKMTTLAQAEKALVAIKAAAAVRAKICLHEMCTG